MRTVSPEKFFLFFARPDMAALGWFGSMLGLVLSVYFYMAALESRELSFFVHPSKTSVARPAKSSQLTVLYDGKTVTGDVTAAQVAIWNAGRRAIHAGAVLKPLVIKTPAGRKIYEATIVKSSRDVVGLRIDQTRAALGEIAVHWSILEENDGGVVQLVYAGDESLDLSASATIEGQREIRSLSYSSRPLTPAQEYEGWRGWRGRLFGAALIVAGLLSWGAVTMLGRSPTLVKVMKFAYGPGVIVVGLAWLLFYRSPTPPFGF